MFARLRALRQAWTQKAAQRQLTVENSNLTRAQLELGRRAVLILGLNDPERFTKHDVLIFLYAVGLNPTDDVIDSKLRAFKLHNCSSISFGELCHIWHSMLQDIADEEEILKRAFQFFDKDGNGEISVAELRNTMHELGNLLSEQEILSFMEIMDVNNDGVIGYQEFLDTLKAHAPDTVGTEDDFFAEEGRHSAPRERPSASAIHRPAAAPAVLPAGPAAESVDGPTLVLLPPPHTAGQQHLHHHPALPGTSSSSAAALQLQPPQPAILAPPPCTRPAWHQPHAHGARSPAHALSPRARRSPLAVSSAHWAQHGGDDAPDGWPPRGEGPQGDVLTPGSTAPQPYCLSSPSDRQASGQPCSSAATTPWGGAPPSPGALPWHGRLQAGGRSASGPGLLPGGRAGSAGSAGGLLLEAQPHVSSGSHPQGPSCQHHHHVSSAAGSVQGGAVQPCAGTPSPACSHDDRRGLGVHGHGPPTLQPSSTSQHRPHDHAAPTPQHAGPGRGSSAGPAAQPAAPPPHHHWQQQQRSFMPRPHSAGDDS